MDKMKRFLGGLLLLFGLTAHGATDKMIFELTSTNDFNAADLFVIDTTPSGITNTWKVAASVVGNKFTNGFVGPAITNGFATHGTVNNASNTLAGMIGSGGGVTPTNAIASWNGLGTNTSFYPSGTNDSIRFFNPAGAQVGEIRSNGVARLPGLIIPTGATSGHVWTTDANGVGSWQASVGGDALGGLALSSWHWTNAVNRMTSKSNTTEYLTFRGGMMGLFTNDPQASVHIYGPSEPQIQIDSTVDDIDHIVVSALGARAFAVDSAGGVGRVIVSSNGTTKALLTSGGDSYLIGGMLGIGTTQPGALLDLTNGAARFGNITPSRLVATSADGTLTNLTFTPANLSSNFIDSLNLSNYVHGAYSEGSIATNGTINLALPRQSISITNNTWLNFTGTNIQNRTFIEVINGGFSVTFTNVAKWITAEPATNVWSGTNWYIFWTKGSSGHVYAEFTATPQGAETFVATSDGISTNLTIRGTLVIDQATQDGYVLTSDGSGGATWEVAPAAGGGTWTNASILYVETNGFALGSAIRGRMDRAYNTITAAVSQAQSGDTIHLGAGTHYVLDSRVALPNNVSLVGLGPHASHIVGNSVLNGAGMGPIVNPGDNSYIGNLSITHTNLTTFGACIGATPISAHAFTNVLVSNVKMFGNTDNVYIDTNALCTIKLVGCVLDSTFDSVFIDQFTNSLVHLVACDIYASNVVNLTVNGENVRNVNVYNGRVILDNCALRAYGGTLWGANIYTADADARVWVNNCFLESGQSGVFNESITNSLGNVWVDGCDVASADVAGPGTTTFSDTRKGAVVATGLTIPTGAVNGHVWTTDANGVGSWQAPGAGSGEINTATNLGSGVVGLFAGKSGTNLTFNSLDNLQFATNASGKAFIKNGAGMTNIIAYTDFYAPSRARAGYFEVDGTGGSVGWLGGGRFTYVDANTVALSNGANTAVGTLLANVQATTLGFPSGPKFVNSGGTLTASNSANTAKADISVASAIVSSNITYVEGTLANVEAAQTGSNYVVDFAHSEWAITAANLTNHIVIKHCTNFHASSGNVRFTSWTIPTAHTNRHLFLCTELTNRIYGTNFLQPVTSFLLVSNAAYRIPFMSKGGNDNFAMGYPQPIAP